MSLLERIKSVGAPKSIAMGSVPDGVLASTTKEQEKQEEASSQFIMRQNRAYRRKFFKQFHIKVPSSVHPVINNKKVN